MTPRSSRAVLRDGSEVMIRSVRATDAARMRTFLDGMCLEARRLRFFTGAVDIDRASELVAATGPDRIGLIARDTATREVVGHALAILIDRDHAEVAVEVADRMHGQGLGTILVARLAERAERRGVRTFVAAVLPDNHEMLAVFRDGFDATVTWRDGAESVEFPTAAWRIGRARFPEGEPHTDT